MGKGEIARYEQFLLFPQCFQKACFPGASKSVRQTDRQPARQQARQTNRQTDTQTQTDIHRQTDRHAGILTEGGGLDDPLPILLHYYHQS